jgi:hypothetical protein
MSDLGTKVLVGCVVYFVLLGLLTVAYFIINKPGTPQAPLISDAMVQQLKNQQAALTSGPVYTNVWNTQIGFDSKTILQTVSLDPWTCMSTCSGSGGSCYGFQVHPDGQTCDLLNSNISSTYGFSNANWNYFQLQSYTPNEAFDGGLANQTGGGAQVGSTVANATLQDCAKYCMSNGSTCTTMSFGPNGCKLWNKLGSGYGAYQEAGSTLYNLVNVQNAIATPPSPSPS